MLGRHDVKERHVEGQMVVDFEKRMEMAMVNISRTGKNIRCHLWKNMHTGGLHPMQRMQSERDKRW